MTFNIRYGTSEDGENRWQKRREILFDVVRRHDPDLIGVQEALDFQIAELTTAVRKYAVIGVGREDGKRAGEYSAILFDKNRFQVAGSGTFWFSDTPTVPASATWGNSYPRICTWARLIDRDGSAFWIYNVHLDHESQPSRQKSVEALRKRIEERIYPSEPVIVTGDFNAPEDNPAMQFLLAPGTPQFVDTFRAMRPHEQPCGTFNAFEFGNVGGPKIDHVLVSSDVTVIRAEIDRTNHHKRYPSDHFPVVAEIRLQRGAD